GVEQAVGRIGQPDRVQLLVYAGGELRLAHIAELAEVAQVLAPAVAQVIAQPLGQVADVSPDLLQVALAQHAQAALAGLEEPEQQMDERRFPGAVRPQDTVYLTG